MACRHPTCSAVIINRVTCPNSSKIFRGLAINHRAMVLTAVPRQSLFLALIVVVLELAAASHFRGATVHWKAVDPANFDGRVSEYSAHTEHDLISNTQRMNYTECM